LSIEWAADGGFTFLGAVAHDRMNRVAKRPAAIRGVALLVISGALSGCGGSARQGVVATIQRWDRALESGRYGVACELMSPAFARDTQTGAAAFGSTSALKGPTNCPRDLQYLATVAGKFAPAVADLTRPVQIEKIAFFSENGMRCAHVTVRCLSGCRLAPPIQMCDMDGWKLTGPA
jgi:hypothetical protein